MKPEYRSKQIGCWTSLQEEVAPGKWRRWESVEGGIFYDQGVWTSWCLTIYYWWPQKRGSDGVQV